MRKFFAVVKRENIQRDQTKFFVIATIHGRLIMARLAVTPDLLFGIRSGGPTRLAIVDQTGKVYERVARELAIDRRAASPTPGPKPEQPPGLNNDPRDRAKQSGNMMQSHFAVEEVKMNGRSLEEV